MTLIAKTRVVAGSGEGRKEFAVGAEVTGLSDHDITQLKRMGALADTADENRAAKAQARERDRAAREFAAAREDVLAAKASVQPKSKSDDDAQA